MTAAPISRRTLVAMVERLPLLKMSEPMRGEALAFLRYQLAALDRPACLSLVPDEANDSAWWIDGQLYQTPRRSVALWAFWMALRDGEARAEWVAPVRTIQNGRARLVRWLEALGYCDLAAELLRVEVGNDGRMYYRRRKDAPTLAFSR